MAVEEHEVHDSSGMLAAELPAVGVFRTAGEPPGRVAEQAVGGVGGEHRGVPLPVLDHVLGPGRIDRDQMPLAEGNRLAQAVGHPRRLDRREGEDRAGLSTVDTRPILGAVVEVCPGIGGIVAAGRGRHDDRNVIVVVEVAGVVRGPPAGAEERGDGRSHRLRIEGVIGPGRRHVGIGDRRLLHVGEHAESPGSPDLLAGIAAGREGFLGVVVECDGQPLLLEVVVAGHPVGCLTGRLDRREEEPDQGADDGDHHEQLNEREAAPDAPVDRPH